VNRHDPPKNREAAVFKSNRSQAVRIPKELAFPAGVKHVTITPMEGGGLLLEPISSHWAEYFKKLERTGKPIGSNDIARSRGMTLVTNNTREFTRLPDLKVENWLN
jgi:virulence-associated protein VagC